MRKRRWRPCNEPSHLSKLESLNSSNQIRHQLLKMVDQGMERPQLFVFDAPALTHGYSSEPLGQSDCLWALSGNNTQPV